MREGKQWSRYSAKSYDDEVLDSDSPIACVVCSAHSEELVQVVLTDEIVKMQFSSKEKIYFMNTDVALRLLSSCV